MIAYSRAFQFVALYVIELCGLSEVHPSADWWSLGAILFEILAGKVCLMYTLIVL